MRASGILLPVFSLPEKYGIGTFGKKAYEFVDFLYKAGQSYWQILPINPTTEGDSPYSSFSANAGNPYFIDLDTLQKDGLLTESDYDGLDFGSDPNTVDYGKLAKNRYAVLKIAYENFLKTEDNDFSEFCNKNSFWLSDYALYVSIKNNQNGKPFYEWEENYKHRDKNTLEKFENDNSKEIGFYKFLQYEFYKQWFNLKDYANKKHIKIIGDMPIYVSADSVDVWADKEQFLLDENFVPTLVSGCPPDAFSKDGQLWNTPVYNWEYMKRGKEKYFWWKQRIKRALEIYDIIRIDHFRGLESFYAVKSGEKTAKNGKWYDGPKNELFEEVKKDLGQDLPIIAEDLGFMTKEVKQLLKDTGFPGMKVLQFAFDSREESDYLPHNYEKNSVVYIGTHDNDTIMGWHSSAAIEDVKFAERYIHLTEKESFNWAMIRTAMSSVSDTAIFTMQDIMGLPSKDRINTPSTVGTNWKWRISDGCANDWLAGIIKEITVLYGRNNQGDLQ